MNRQIGRQWGFTLIEMMIALTVGLIVTGAVGTLFIQSRSSYTQNDEINNIQENGRYALKVIANELRMAQFWGGMQSVSNATMATDNTGLVGGVTATLDQTANGCGTTDNWNYSFTPTATTPTLSYLNNTDSTTVTAAYPCVTSIDDGTDVLMVKRARGLAFTDTDDLTPGRPYIRTNQVNATVFKMSTETGLETTDPPAGYSDWQYLARIYYVKNSQLMRQALNEDSSDPDNDPAFEAEILADGIERFHIEFGIDNGTDGVADFFTSSPTKEELRVATVAHVYVLVRSVNTLPNNYTNPKSFTLGSLAVNDINNDDVGDPFNDGYYRKVMSTTVIMRNPIASIRM